MSLNILRIDSSARKFGSVSRQLTEQLIKTLGGGSETRIVTRDAADGLPLINEDWVGANFTPADTRSDTQKHILALSDELVAEVMDADVIIIGAPIYNFSVPAALKAWIDLVCRAGLTFRYTANGPEGLLKDKRVILAVASGGTAVDSAIDYAVPYLRHVMGFIGLTDVTVVAADQLGQNAEAKLAQATATIERLAA